MNLSIKPGEFVTLLGPSGSGKSTTLAMVAGFELPTSGRIVLNGKDITTQVTHKRGLGMVFQGYALFPHMTVFDNVAFPLRLRKTPKAQVQQRVTETLETVSLGKYASRRPAELSGGQQQRVALARAFVHRPPILLMDEPLSALDKNLRAQMQAEIRRLHRELGTTVLFVTHDQEEALGLSDRVAVMNEGAVSQIGTPSEMYELPHNEFVASFLGAANFLAGKVVRQHNEITEVALDNGTVIRGPSGATLAAGDAVKALLRPEDGVPCTLGAGANEVLVRPTDMVYLGERVRVGADFIGGGDGFFWADHGSTSAIQLGETMSMSWPVARTAIVPATT
ncbi:ABC transporter ATP-binding protein [Mycobacterium sp. NPDC006124]|uniref:ABC transporter ATP-binding protein n=1 Tax=Mycobacterium sp. NPDC006124 TaxID=3156729 RepID=UPI0033A7B8D2